MLATLALFSTTPLGSFLTGCALPGLHSLRSSLGSPPLLSQEGNFETDVSTAQEHAGETPITRRKPRLAGAPVLENVQTPVTQRASAGLARERAISPRGRKTNRGQSFAPSGLCFLGVTLPSAHALGYILTRLQRWATPRAERGSSIFQKCTAGTIPFPEFCCAAGVREYNGVTFPESRFLTFSWVE